MYFLCMVLIGCLCSIQSYSQDNKIKQQKENRNYYRKALQVDSVKAEKVSQIQAIYKAGINQLMADTSLNDAVKRVRIKSLMDAKNQQLRLLLSPTQQAKIIPTTEREQVSPAKTN